MKTQVSNADKAPIDSVIVKLKLKAKSYIKKPRKAWTLITQRK